MEQYQINGSEVHFVNASCDSIFGNNQKLHSEQKELYDPLQGINNEVEPKFYRVNSVVFAEPLGDVSSTTISLKNGISTSESDHDKMIIIDKVTVHQRAGKKYKKYHIVIEDSSSLICPQLKCNRTFSTTKLLKAHIRKVHCADKRYICDVCGNAFACRYLLVRHSAVHSGRTVQCPVCQIVLSGRTSLSSHLRTHSGIKAHACAVCRKTFSRKSTLDNHVKFVHKESQLQCPKCHDWFETRTQWSRHLTTHRGNKQHGVQS